SAQLVEGTSVAKVSIVVNGTAVAHLITTNSTKVVDCAKILRRSNHRAIWFVVDGTMVVESKRPEKCIVVDCAIVVDAAVQQYCSTVIHGVIVDEGTCASKSAKNIECTIINNDRVAMVIHVKTATSSEGSVIDDFLIVFDPKIIGEDVLRTCQTSIVNQDTLIPDSTIVLDGDARGNSNCYATINAP